MILHLTLYDLMQSDENRTRIVKPAYRINSYKILSECYNLVRFYKNDTVRIDMIRWLDDSCTIFV